MSDIKHDIILPPIAEDVEFDPNNCDAISSDNVQDAIDELCQEVATSASPGFTWGKSGNVSANTWLLNDTVPSNKSGRQIFLVNPKLETIFVTNELSNTFDVGVFEHDGVTFTLLTTVSLVSARSASFDAGSLSLTQDKELAIRITSGSCKNVVVGVLLSGSIP